MDEAVATGIDILYFLGQENFIFIREFWKELSVATMRVHQINMYICTFKAKQNVLFKFLKATFHVECWILNNW